MDRFPHGAPRTMMDRHACLRFVRAFVLAAALLAACIWAGLQPRQMPNPYCGANVPVSSSTGGVRSAGLMPVDDRSVVLTSGEVELRPAQAVNHSSELRVLVADGRHEEPSLSADALERPAETPSDRPVGRERVLAPPGGLAGTEEPIPPRLLDASRQVGSASEKTPEQPPALLPQTVEAATRSDNLERIAREADAHTRRAFELGGRSAYYSARAEFIAALRLLAQGLDGEYRTDAHSRALADGLTALREADDFIPRGAQIEADLDVQSTINGHRTPALKGMEPARLAPGAAMQAYLTYAQEQLAAAAGGEVAASMALRGLGKLHETIAEKNVQGIVAPQPKAVAFFQAALLAFPQNHMAWNDLGVLLARNGRLDEARMALENSASFSQNPAAWQNLAAVYQRLGQLQLAERAYRQSQALQQAASRPAGGPKPALPVEWLDPKTFARTGSDTPPGPVPAPVTLPAEKRVSQSPHGNSPDTRK